MQRCGTCVIQWREIAGIHVDFFIIFVFFLVRISLGHQEIIIAHRIGGYYLIRMDHEVKLFRMVMVTLFMELLIGCTGLVFFMLNI